jgi:serine-type D-Ala-D-Ala carboxypeptidase (penicillin-binding protein 5/6)
MSMRDLGILAKRLIEEFPEYYPIFAETEFNYKDRAPPMPATATRCCASPADWRPTGSRPATPPRRAMALSDRPSWATGG